MVATPGSPVTQTPVAPTTIGQAPPPIVTWEALPDDVPLDDEPVENTGQPLLAGALRESLELIGFIQPEMLIASNFGLCATVNNDLVIKAPDWVYVPSVQTPEPDRRSYTPNLQGATPIVVMEFLLHKDGSEYSVKRTFPPGKWFFYEQILRIPVYVILEPSDGLLEVYQLTAGRYELQPQRRITASGSLTWGYFWVSGTAPKKNALATGCAGGTKQATYYPGQWSKLSKSANERNKNANERNKNANERINWRRICDRKASTQTTFKGNFPTLLCLATS